MATVDDIATRVNEYRSALKKQVDDAAASITSEQYESGGAFSFGGGANPALLFPELYADLSDRAQIYSNALNQSTTNRAIEKPADLAAVSLSFTTETPYNTTDYNIEILPAADKNLLGWESESVDDFKTPAWTGDVITVDNINHITDLYLDADAQLNLVQAGWEKAQFDLNAAMDLEGAKLGARGFRRANSWLKRQHLDLMRRFSDTYHEASRKVAAVVLDRLRENAKTAMQLLASKDSSNMDFNTGYAGVYDTVAKTFFAVKGLANSVAIDEWKYEESIGLDKLQAELKRTISIQSAMVSMQVDLFKASANATLAEWEAEVKRVTAELTVESENAQIDVTTQKLVSDSILSKIDTIHNAKKAMISVDKSQYGQKISSLIGSFEEYLKMLGSSNQNALGVATGKG